MQSPGSFFYITIELYLPAKFIYSLMYLLPNLYQLLFSEVSITKKLIKFLATLFQFLKILAFFR